MRVMVIVKANKDTEAGVMPSEQLLADMGKFNEELVKAGVLLAAEGLQPSKERGSRPLIFDAVCRVDDSKIDGQRVCEGAHCGWVGTKDADCRSSSRGPRKPLEFRGGRERC